MGLTCAVEESDTKCNAPGSISFDAGDVLTLHSYPVTNSIENQPTPASVAWSLRITPAVD